MPVELAGHHRAAARGDDAADLRRVRHLDAGQATRIGRLADGIVVGSAIVKAAGSSIDAAVDLVATLRRALDAI